MACYTPCYVPCNQTISLCANPCVNPCANPCSNSFTICWGNNPSETLDFSVTDKRADIDANPPALNNTKNSVKHIYYCNNPNVPIGTKNKSSQYWLTGSTPPKFVDNVINLNQLKFYDDQNSTIYFETDLRPSKTLGLESVDNRSGRTKGTFMIMATTGKYAGKKGTITYDSKNDTATINFIN